MPPRRRRQQHRGQRARRERRYVSGGQGQSYKPGFPMNLFTGRAALATFAAVGVVLMVAGISLAAFLPNRGGDADIDELPTPPPTEEPVAGEPTEDPDVVVRNFEAADYVISELAETYTATITTAKGEIVIELFAEDAPNTVNSFVFLAENQYFDGLLFHRVIADFVVQSGDPTGTGGGGPGYQTADEPNEIRNETGTITMAKVAGQSSFGSQFFINLKDNPGLDFDTTARDRFYPFGVVVEGMEVVLSIVQGDVIESITITRTPRPDAPTPEGEGEDAGDGEETGESEEPEDEAGEN